MEIILLIAAAFVVYMFVTGRKLSRENDRINREFKENAEAAKQVIEKMRRLR